MSLQTIRTEVVWPSIVGAVNYAAPIANEGCLVEIQVIAAPGSFVTLQGSSDKVTWTVLTDVDAANMATLVTGTYYTAREMPPWVRLGTAADAAGPRVNRVMLLQTKVTH